MNLGGSALNCMLVEGFDNYEQDLDFFWKGGSYDLFSKAVDRFKRKLKQRILQEKTCRQFFIEFILLIDNNRQLKIQFIFGREKTNISFILNSFDIDIVQIGFDGTNVISVRT